MLKAKSCIAVLFEAEFIYIDIYIFKCMYVHFQMIFWLLVFHWWSRKKIYVGKLDVSKIDIYNFYRFL